MHIFISYAKFDTRDLALKIRDRLTAIPGVTAWMDESLEAASSWASQIQVEIDRCDYVLVLLSPDVNRPATATRARSFVLNEIDYAQQEHKAIIPVMAQKTRVPVQLAGIQYIDFTGDSEAGMRRLMLDIQRRAGLPISEAEARQAGITAAPLQRDPKIVLGVVAVVVLVMVAALVVILQITTSGVTQGTSTPSETPNIRTQSAMMDTIVAGTRQAQLITPTATASETPNFETQAASLKTDIAATDQAALITSTPTLDSTQIIATAIAYILATQTAEAPTATLLPTATRVPTKDALATAAAQASSTTAALAVTDAAQNIEETRNAQLTANIPTAAPSSTARATFPPTSTSTGTPTLTATVTPTANPSETAQAIGAQQTAVLDLALATAAAESAEQDRIRRAAFNITSVFEGVSYATYQNYDTGIISYGRFQLTLASGNLYQVVSQYVSQSDSAVAAELSADYLARIEAEDATLRTDDRLKTLLTEAASEPAMQAAQDQVATDVYWNAVQTLSIQPRNIQTALGQALIFDIIFQYGLQNSIITSAEEALGVPSRSAVGQNGITEAQLITKIAEINRDNLYNAAQKNNLPGLKIRGDFWFNLITAGDWNLQGDADGNIQVKGRTIQVRNP